MFEIKDITNEQAAEFFNNDPALAYLGLSDEFLYYLYHEKKFDPGPLCTLKGIYKEDKLLMIFKYEPFAQVTLNTHYYLSSRMHNTGTFKDIVDFIHKWIKEAMPHITKVITMSPSTCEHVPPIVEKYGFVKEAHIKDCIRWRQKVVDLYIFGKEV